VWKDGLLYCLHVSVALKLAEDREAEGQEWHWEITNGEGSGREQAGGA